MVRPYAMELRTRAMDALDEGATCRDVADRFAISVSAVVKWSQRLRHTGSVAPAKQGATPPRKLAGERDFILERIAEHPSITTRALAAELSSRGIEASHMAVWRLVRAEGMTFKKNCARGRTNPSGCGQAPAALEGSPAQDRSAPAGLRG